MFQFQRVSEQYQTEFDALRAEVHKLADLFRESSFFGDPNNFQHAHYGYLMACMGRLDQYSAFWRGTVQGDRSNQTKRMIDFLATFVYPLPEYDRVHSVVVKMFRHSLMHTGALRFAFDRQEGVGYTWRVHFGKLPNGLDHYSITKVDQSFQDVFLRAPLPAGHVLKEIRAINMSIPLLVTGLYQGISRYMHLLRESADLQNNFLAAEGNMVLQTFDRLLPTPRSRPPETA